MRNILAITMALMLAAVILSPAVGYTIQSGSNESYSIASTMVNYSFHAGEPASNLTPESIPPALSPTSAVTVTQVPYSIKIGAAAPYSIKLVNAGTTGGVSLPAQTIGTTAAPSTEAIGVQTPAAATAPTAPAQQPAIVTPPENVTPAENVTAPAPAAAPAKLSIMGTVYDDTNGNGIKEANETGLAGWLINLEHPMGTIIANTTTSESGSYAFNDLSPGVYTVLEILPQGWSAVMPVDGFNTVNLTVMNAENVDFANKMTAQEKATTPANMTTPEGNVTA
jgi:hypothetical protein